MPEKSIPGVNHDHSTSQSDDRWPCLVPFTRMVVTYDGSVRFCPDDWRKETVIGNIRDNSIAELWQSDTMKNLRRSHLDGSIDHKTCLNCTDWSSIKWGYDYTVALNDLFGEEVV
jgi:radical SAM protein with 4Fe4S-binding SPASM domain